MSLAGLVVSALTTEGQRKFWGGGSDGIVQLLECIGQNY